MTEKQNNEQDANKEWKKWSSGKCPGKVRRPPVWYEHVTAGALAGIISKTVTAPLDRLKIFAQVEAYHKDMSMKDATKKIVQQGGITSMWKGNFISVVKVGPEYATKFAMYDFLKKTIQDGDPARVLTIGERFLAAAGAGVSSQTLVYPFDVVKTRRMLTFNKYSIGKIVSLGWKSQGFIFFYQGLIASMLGSLIFTGLDLSIYETLKRRYHNIINSFDKQGCPEDSSLLILFCGMTSSSIAQVASFPLSSITSTVQVYNKQRGAPVFEVYRSAVRHKWGHGFRAMYRGLQPSLLKGVPAMCCTYLVYEATLSLWGTSME